MLLAERRGSPVPHLGCCVGLQVLMFVSQDRGATVPVGKEECQEETKLNSMQLC